MSSRKGGGGEPKDKIGKNELKTNSDTDFHSVNNLKLFFSENKRHLGQIFKQNKVYLFCHGSSLFSKLLFSKRYGVKL